MYAEITRDRRFLPGGATLTRPTDVARKLRYGRPAQAQRRRARVHYLPRNPVTPPFCRVAAAPYPAYGSCDLSLIYPLARLKLPVLTASKSLRRSRKAGACRDKSKGPRSGDFAGRSPGVQGAAATGRPLCAPCAMPGITQTINRERNVR